MARRSARRRVHRARRKPPPPAWLRLGPPEWLQLKTGTVLARKRPPTGWVQITFVQQKKAQARRVQLHYQPKGGATSSIVLAYARAKSKLGRS